MPRSAYISIALLALLGTTWLVVERAPSPSAPTSDGRSAVATGVAADSPVHRGWNASAQSATAPSTVDVTALAASLVDQGRAALADGDLKRGFEAYRRAVEYNPTAETHGLVGDLYLRMAVRSEASFHLRRAAELDAENPDRWIALANAYYLSTDPIAAAKALERAKALEPTIVIERDDNNFVVRGQTGSPERDS